MIIGNRFPWTFKAEWTDDTGRLLLVKGLIDTQMYTLASLYAPNTSQACFLEQALDTLAAFAEGILVIGGDFNLTIDSRVDTSSGSFPLSYASLQN